MSSWGLWGLHTVSNYYGRGAEDYENTPAYKARWTHGVDWKTADAFDDEYETWDDEETVPKTGVWYHSSPHKLEPGTQLLPGYEESTYSDFYDEEDGISPHKRKGWVWLEPDKDGASQWTNAHLKNYLYEVHPEREPHPWNGTGSHGHVTPSAVVKRMVGISPEGDYEQWHDLPPEHTAASTDGIRYAHIVEADVAEDLMKLAMPRQDAYDKGTLKRNFGGNPDQAPPFPGPWFHGSPDKLEVGDILHPGAAKNYEYDGDRAPRQNWVFMDLDARQARMWAGEAVKQRRMPHDSPTYVYRVEPLDEGPWPWNEYPDMGYASPRARVVERRHVDEMGDWDQQPQFGHRRKRNPSKLLERLRAQMPASQDRTARLAMPSRDAYDYMIMDKKKKTDDIPEGGSFYHGSDHEHQPGDILESVRARGDQDRIDYYENSIGAPNHADWVWMYNHPAPATKYHKNVYELEPLDEGPWIWNNILRDDGQFRPTENDEDFPRLVSPRARIVRKLSPDEHGAANAHLTDYYQKLRDQRTARLAAVSDDMVNQLHDEFSDWYDHTGHASDHDAAARQRVQENYGITDNGPVSHWPNVENFLKEHYPAAHRGLEMGMEHAGPLLDGEEPWPDTDEPASREPYQTGPDAVARHGYDPKGVAAAFMLMHLQVNNREKRWPGITDEAQQRLNDIFDKRQQMQRQHEQRTARLAAVNQDLVDRLDRQFHGWWTDTFADRHRAGAPEVKSWLDHGDHDAGPTSHWPNIEAFLKERYPAAHKGHDMGLEEAGHILDGHDPMPYQQHGTADLTPYATGPEAETTHGYDPKEIAAGMLLLHNRSHPLRGDMAQEDQDRLTDIFTKRQQMQRSYEQRNTRLGAKYYHLTDDPDFRLDPEYRPEINTTLGGEAHVPGVFVAPDPGAWFSGHQYHRPYVAEFDVPDDVFGREDARAKGYRNEKFIPSKYFNDVTHVRTIPYDAHVREEYGSYGPTESASGKDFQTGHPISPARGNLRDFPEGYQYPGPADPEWHENYQKTMDQYHRADGSDFSGGWENYQDPRIGTYAWNPEGHKAWYHPATGEYHRRPNVSFRGVEVDAELHEFSRTPWDEVGEGHDDDHHTAARLAMAWDEWSDKIKHFPSEHGGMGYYTIAHDDGSESSLNYYVNVDDDQGGDDPRLGIDHLVTSEPFRSRGIAESFFRRLHKDYPHHTINPGYMTQDGQKFHDRMLDKEPSHRGLLATGDA